MNPYNVSLQTTSLLKFLNKCNIWMLFYHHETIKCVTYFKFLSTIIWMVSFLPDLSNVTLQISLFEDSILNRYLLRFFDCLVHPNLSATFATDQKWPLCHLCISYQSLAGGLRSWQKSEFLKLIILIFHVKKLNN